MRKKTASSLSSRMLTRGTSYRYKQRITLSPKLIIYYFHRLQQQQTTASKEAHHLRLWIIQTLSRRIFSNTTQLLLHNYNHEALSRCCNHRLLSSISVFASRCNGWQRQDWQDRSLFFQRQALQILQIQVQGTHQDKRC